MIGPARTRLLRGGPEALRRVGYLLRRGFEVVPLPALAIGLLLPLVGVSIPGPARATSSIFNAEGLGRWMDHYDLAARGAGWTSIGVVDRYQMSTINPASIGWVDEPQIFVGLVGQNLWIQNDTSDTRDRVGETRIPAVNLVVPLPSQIRVGAGYRDLTEGTYEAIVFENVGRDDELERRRSGTGSLGELHVSVGARVFRDRLTVAARYGITSGTLREEDEVLFVHSPYVDTRNVVRTRMENARPFSFGVQARVTDRLSIGGFYGPSADVDLKSLLTTSSGFTNEERADFALPETFGLGASVVLGRFRLSGDWSRRSWSESGFRVVQGQFDGSSGFANLVDADRFGIGLVRLASAEQQSKDPLFERARWRIGFTTGDLSVTQRDGAVVGEWTVTGGLGLPVQFDRGYVDALVEFGRRGDLDEVRVRETFLRLGFGVTFAQLQRTF